MNPTARTVAYLRWQGFLAAVVESWIRYANRRRDLFGFADVLAVHSRDDRFLLVQVTTVDHVADRLAKARTRSDLAAWLRAGGAFEVHGRMQRNGRWCCKRVAVQVADLAPVVIATPARRRRPCKGERQGMLFE